MLEFVHHNVKTLEELLENLNRIQKLYYDRSFDFENELNKFIQEILDYLKTKGDASKVSEILKMRNMISTVKKGFDPIKMEKIKRKKRKTLWGFRFQVLDGIQKILREDYQKEKNKIDEGEEILSNLILTCYQKGILDEVKLSKLNAVPKIELFWRQLIDKNESISGVDKKLRLKLNSQDIYLILERTLAKIS